MFKIKTVVLFIIYFMKPHLFILFVLAFAGCNKKNKVEGSLHIHGQIRDEYSGAPVTNVSLILYEVRKGSIMSQNYLWDLSPSSYSYSIDANGNYQLNYITDKTSDLGYVLGWKSGDDKYYSVFDINGIFSFTPAYCLTQVNKNEFEFNIPMMRNSFHKARLIDQAPYTSSDTIYFASGIKKFRLYNVNHDTISYSVLPPNAKRQYALLKVTYTKMDTLQSGWLNTTNTGDTLSTEIYY